MARITFTPTHCLLTCLLALPAAASAQSLNDLACAAGVSCAGFDRQAPADVRMVWGINDEASARERFLAASREYPAELWRCAVSGQCDDRSQTEARATIPLPAEAFAPSETVRREAGLTRQDGPQIIEVDPSRTATGSDIQPRDGNWLGTPGRTQLSGCPQALAGALASKLPAVRAGQRSFQAPFHPSQILPDPTVRWQRTGANRWRGELADTRGQAAHATWTLHVASPERIEATSTMEVRLMGVCRATTPITLERR